VVSAFDAVDAALFDIGSTLVMGPSVSPTKEIALAFGLNADEARALTRLIMCQDFDGPQDVCAAIEQLGHLVTPERRAIVGSLWLAQEGAASPIPGADDALSAFVSAGKTVGLLSDIWAPYFRSVETALPHVVSRSRPFLSFRCGLKKPDPAFFDTAAKGLGAPPSRIVMIGDSYLEDIEPAIAAGMRTAWVLSRPEKERANLLNVLAGRAPRPDWIVATTAEVITAMQTTLTQAPLRIANVWKHSEGELLERLRAVTLLKDRSVEIYRGASISVERLAPESIAPAQLYVLQEALELQRQLRYELQRFGVDSLALDGFVEIEVEGRDGRVGLLPPVVEESIEANGRVVNLICDGMHRVYLSRLEWVMPKVVFVRGLDRRYPYYAYPNTNGWDDVKLVTSLKEETGEKTLKKWHRIENYKSLYRDFSVVFSNLSVPRGAGR
jgi:FMN phosphatase YigB (HAD superfamily)